MGSAWRRFGAILLCKTNSATSLRFALALPICCFSSFLSPGKTPSPPLFARLGDGLGLLGLPERLPKLKAFSSVRLPTGEREPFVWGIDRASGSASPSLELPPMRTRAVVPFSVGDDCDDLKAAACALRPPPLRGRPVVGGVIGDFGDNSSVRSSCTSGFALLARTLELLLPELPPKPSRAPPVEGGRAKSSRALCKLGEVSPICDRRAPGLAAAP
mmetsp:Transcript_92561/g.205766  ORF Transcript_92561/g.205766 Transcript_92561/m.205766 type:complete len:216 (+) Transcript_92561:1673-2320(+)